MANKKKNTSEVSQPANNVQEATVLEAPASETSVQQSQGLSVTGEVNSPAGMYLNDLVTKFNADKNHPDLSAAQKNLLSNVVLVSQNLDNLVAQGQAAQKQMNEAQQKVGELNLALASERGKLQGLTEALLALRPADVG